MVWESFPDPVQTSLTAVQLFPGLVDGIPVPVVPIPVRVQIAPGRVVAFAGFVETAPRCV